MKVISEHIQPQDVVASPIPNGLKLPSWFLSPYPGFLKCQKPHVSTELAPLSALSPSWPHLPLLQPQCLLHAPLRHQARSCPRTFSHAEPATDDILPQVAMWLFYPGSLRSLPEHSVRQFLPLITVNHYNSGQSPALPTVRQEKVGTGPASVTAVCWVLLATTLHLSQCSGTAYQMTK